MSKRGFTLKVHKSVFVLLFLMVLISAVYAVTIVSSSSLVTSRVTANEVIISSTLKLTPLSITPVCDVIAKGSVYYDSTINKPCYCDGSFYVTFSDGAACS